MIKDSILCTDCNCYVQAEVVDRGLRLHASCPDCAKFIKHISIADCYDFVLRNGSEYSGRRISDLVRSKKAKEHLNFLLEKNIMLRDWQRYVINQWL